MYSVDNRTNYIQSDQNPSPIYRFVPHRINPIWIGWLLLFLSLGIGCLSIYSGSFVDEADNLSVGWLITQKFILYRDVFSHHFPFAYYWSAFIIALFGKSIFAVRLSVWLYQILAFGIAMQFSGYFWPIGLTSLAWSILHTLYRNNQILYNPFAAGALFVVFILTFRSLQSDIWSFRKIAVILGIFSFIAILSDPLSIYAICVALFFLAIKNKRLIIYTIMTILIGACGYFGLLIVSGSLQGFIQEAIIFNATIYSKYLNTGPFRFLDFFKFIFTGLDITNHVWYNLNPYNPIIAGNIQLDQWIFTGFFYRFGIIICSLFLFSQRNYLLSLFVYVFSCSTLLINVSGFRSTSFILVALVTIFAVITNSWELQTDGSKIKIINLGKLFLRFIMGIMLVWMFFRGAQFLYQQRNNLTYNMQFSSIDESAKQIMLLTCNTPDVKLLNYPGGLYSYWFSGLLPASKYMFMFPWVADIGLSDVINDLKQEHSLVIVNYQRESIWGVYDTDKYMQPLLEFLNKNYKKINDREYISQDLYDLCNTNQ